MGGLGRRRMERLIPDDRWVDEVVARRVPAGDVEAGWVRVGVERRR